MSRAAGARGYSLLEVMFAVVLLAVVFVGLTGYMRVQRKALGISDRQSEAARVAATTLDDEKTKLSDTTNFTKLLASLESKSGHRDSTRTKKTLESRDYEVDVVKETLGVPGMVRVRVRANWDKRKHSFTLSKLMVP